MKDDTLKKTFKLAWPTVFESVFTVLAQMIDTYMLSALGTSAVAAVGLTSQPMYFLMAPIFALNSTVGALIARRRGENNKTEAHGIARFAILIAAVYSLLVGAGCVLFGKQIILLCGGNAETKDAAAIYFSVVLGGLVFNSLTMMLNAIQRGCENTRIAMISNATGTAVNVILNYCLIYGHFGMPRLGVAGAAIATVTGYAVSFGIALCSLISKKNYITLGKLLFARGRRISKDAAAATMNMGFNTMSEDILKRFAFLYIGVLAAKTGTDAFAAHQVGMSLLNLAFAFGLGMQTAAVTLAGNAMGSKDIPLARRYTIRCQIVGLALGITVSGLILLFGDNFFGFYFTEASVLTIGAKICRIIAVIVPIQIVQIIFSGTLRGCGDIRYTLISSTAVFGVFNIAIDSLFVLVFHIGIYGIWTGTLLAQSLLAASHLIRYCSGRWETKKI